jgi:outer membrane protein OmpA-like peptidoglycan-associated protein
MNFLSKIGRICLILTLPLSMSAQDEEPILLVNPSFEDEPKCCEAPQGWYNCGRSDESPPDIQPGSFQVIKTPSNGVSYVGLVVRDNDTWESIGQRLSRPLEQGKCYEFTIDLCRAEEYVSLSRTTMEEVDYTIPAKLLVWGGMGYCDKRELLYETSVVTNTRWLGSMMRFQPKNGNYTYLMFEAYFKTPILFPYNGNILMDNASPIKPVPCKPKAPPIVQREPVKPPVKPPVSTGTKAPEKTIGATEPPANGIDRSKIKKGDIIRLNKIYFEANKYDITEASTPALEEVLNFLKENPDVFVEIGGHTNNRPSPEFADELSTNRAKAVATWLSKHGIPVERVKYKGYGKRYPIATNETPEGRSTNQRVEIKILSMNGE